MKRLIKEEIDNILTIKAKRFIINELNNKSGDIVDISGLPEKFSKYFSNNYENGITKFFNFLNGLIKILHLKTYDDVPRQLNLKRRWAIGDERYFTMYNEQTKGNVHIVFFNEKLIFAIGEDGPNSITTWGNSQKSEIEMYSFESLVVNNGTLRVGKFLNKRYN